MDDNVWEYPFGDLDDDEELFEKKPALTGEAAPIIFFKAGYTFNHG
jgi:hypothetical protein